MGCLHYVLLIISDKVFPGSVDIHDCKPMYHDTSQADSRVPSGVSHKPVHHVSSQQTASVDTKVANWCNRFHLGLCTCFKPLYNVTSWVTS